MPPLFVQHPRNHLYVFAYIDMLHTRIVLFILLPFLSHHKLYYLPWIFHFADQPQVSLQLGSTLNPDDIKEGDDVYFECHIKANPKENRITWWHDVSIPPATTIIIINYYCICERGINAHFLSLGTKLTWACPIIFQVCIEQKSSYQR